MSIPTLLQKTVFPIFNRINKRIRFVISVLLLCGAMAVSTFFFFDAAWIFLPILIVLAYMVTYFSVLEGIEKVEWTMLFIMPVLLTISFYMFYFLFPARWLTRIPFLFLYGFSLYAVLLASNIFNVGVERSLQLYRAAFAVNYLFQTVVSFLLLSVLFTFKQNFVVNGLFAFLIVFALNTQLLWTAKPKLKFDKKLIQYTFLISVICAQLAVVLSFLPVKPTIASLFVTGCYYSISGIIYHYIDERLFKYTVREYSIVLVVVSILLFLSIQW